MNCTTNILRPLKQGRITEAHDILLEIHRVSFELENKINPPSQMMNHGIVYDIITSARFDRLALFDLKSSRGGLVHAYIGKDIGLGYETYTRSQSKEPENVGNQWPHVRIKVDKPSPTCTVKVYQEIVQESTPT